MDSVDLKFFKEFEKIEHEYDELLMLLESVEVMSDNKLFAFYLKRKKSLDGIAVLFKKYRSIENEIKLNQEIFALEKDDETKNYIVSENQKLEAEKQKVFEALKTQFSLSNSTEEQMARIEITPKNEDEEFTVQIQNMICEMFKNSKIEVLNKKTTSITLSAVQAYDKLSFLSGLVKTIKQGKENLFQVVVLKIDNETIEIDEKDIVIEISKSSGAGGQHINKTESAVKLTHIPTGISAECQDERSQTKNKVRALENLRNKILQKYQENAQKNIEKQRQNQKNAVFGSTPVLIFDFDRNKVNDSRTKKTYDLKEILSGNTEILQSDLRV